MSLNPAIICKSNDSARRMGNWSCPLRFSGTRHPCRCCQEGNVVVFWEKIGMYHKDSIPFHLVYCVMTASLQDSNNVQNQTHIICHLTDRTTDAHWWKQTGGEGKSNQKDQCRKSAVGLPQKYAGKPEGAGESRTGNG